MRDPPGKELLKVGSRVDASVIDVVIILRRLFGIVQHEGLIEFQVSSEGQSLQHKQIISQSRISLYNSTR